MNSNSWNNVTYKLFVYKSYVFNICMYKADLALNNRQELICRKASSTNKASNQKQTLTYQDMLGFGKVNDCFLSSENICNYYYFYNYYNWLFYAAANFYCCWWWCGGGRERER